MQPGTESMVGRDARAPVLVRAAASTDVGLVRPNNEDRYLLADLASGRHGLPSSRLSAAGIVFGVCDGMGGHAAGEVASQIAVDTILSEMARASIALDFDEFGRALIAAVQNAGRAIRADVVLHPDRKGMGTTCTAAVVRGGRMLVAQVGDSRAYLLRNGTLRQLTSDQTIANLLVSQGHTTAEKAARLENGSHLLQSVGSEELDVTLSSVELVRGDRVLICSDGLSGLVNDAQLLETAGVCADLKLGCERLVEAAKVAGGRDNITVVLCEFSGEGLPLSDRDASADLTIGGMPDQVPRLERLYRPPRRRQVSVAALMLLSLLALGWLVAPRTKGAVRAGASRPAVEQGTSRPSRLPGAVSESSVPDTQPVPLDPAQPPRSPVGETGDSQTGTAQRARVRLSDRPTPHPRQLAPTAPLAAEAEEPRTKKNPF